MDGRLGLSQRTSPRTERGAELELGHADYVHLAVSLLSAGRFDAAEVDARLRADLMKCSMSIHLIGQRFSLTPEGSANSLAEIQNERAIERGEQGDFTRLVWIPPGVPPADPRQQHLIDRLRSDPRMGERADLLEIPLEDLRTVIQSTLERIRSPKTVTLASGGRGTSAGFDAFLLFFAGALVFDDASICATIES